MLQMFEHDTRGVALLQNLQDEIAHSGRFVSHSHREQILI